jgi:hypothetical protein
MDAQRYFDPNCNGWRAWVRRECVAGHREEGAEVFETKDEAVAWCLSQRCSPDEPIAWVVSPRMAG